MYRKYCLRDNFWSNFFKCTFANTLMTNFCSKNEKTSSVCTADGWLKLNLASCVIRQTRSLGAPVLCYSKANTAAASSRQQSSSISLEEPAEKKGNKRTAWPRSRWEYPGTWYVSHEKDTFDNEPQANWRRGLLQKATTMRDWRVAHMFRRSFRDVRRPRHLPNATAAIRRFTEIMSETDAKESIFSFVRTRYIIRMYVQKSNPTC